MSSLYENLKKLEEKKVDNIPFNYVENIKSEKKSNKVPFLLAILAIVILLFSATITLIYYPNLVNFAFHRKKDIIKVVKENDKDVGNLNYTSDKYKETIQEVNLRDKESTISPIENIENKNEAIKKPPLDVISKEQAKEKDNALIIQNNEKKFLQNLEESQKDMNLNPQLSAKFEKKEEIPIKSNLISTKEVSSLDISLETAVIKKRLIQQAENLRQKNDFKGAAEIYERIWNEYKDTDAANNLGASLIMLGDFKKAQSVFEQALKINPNDEELLFNYNQLKEKINN